MPSWASHLLYCNYCWRISQAYLFDESLLLCSEKEVQIFIRWLQPGLNWGEVKHEGGSGLDSPRAVEKCAPWLRWYFSHLVGGVAWQGETLMTTSESASAQWYRTWEKVGFLKLRQTYQWLTSDIYILLYFFSRLDFETRTTKTWNQNLKPRGQHRRNRDLMCLHWAGESSLPVISEQEARWGRGLERFWVVLTASSRSRELGGEGKLSSCLRITHDWWTAGLPWEWREQRGSHGRKQGQSWTFWKSSESKSLKSPTSSTQLEGQ